MKFNEMQRKENEKRLSQTRENRERNIERIKKNIDEKERLTIQRLNGLMTQKNKTFQEQKEKEKRRIQFIKESLRKSQANINERNKKILEHQEHIDVLVAQLEKNKKKKFLQRAKSQNELYIRSIEKRQNNDRLMLERFDQINQKMENKEKKISKEKKNKIQDLTLRQEDEFIKQYEKQHSILRLNRITNYKNRKKAEEISEKEKKTERNKKKKQILRENKTKLTDSIEKEKQELIVRFENILQKNKKIDAEVVKKLFPEDKELYNKIKNLTDEVYNKCNNDQSKMKKSGENSNIKSDDELVFITQKNKNNQAKSKKKKIK